MYRRNTAVTFTYVTLHAARRVARDFRAYVSTETVLWTLSRARSPENGRGGLGGRASGWPRVGPVGARLQRWRRRFAFRARVYHLPPGTTHSSVADRAASWTSAGRAFHILPRTAITATHTHEGRTPLENHFIVRVITFLRCFIIFVLFFVSLFFRRSQAAATCGSAD